MLLIVGLGNPGKDYTMTRHNAGFLALDELKKLDNFTDFKEEKKFFCEMSMGELDNKKIILVKPTTFMNDSGKCVGKIMDFYKITPDQLILVHDDKDLPLGEVRVQIGRGDAGHNGVKSVYQTLNDKNFVRVRVGIASDNEKKMSDTGKFVLGKFGIFERKKLSEGLKKAVQEILQKI